MHEPSARKGYKESTTTQSVRETINEGEQMGKTKLAVLTLAIVVVVEGILYGQLQITHNRLVDSHGELQGELISLQNVCAELNVTYHLLSEEHGDLQYNYESLSRSHSDLQSQHSVLENTYSNLQNQHNQLQISYDSLARSYRGLQEDYEVEKCLRIGNSLESYYDLLREELGPTGTKRWWTYSESYWQTAVDFAANLAMHDLRRIYWPRIEDDYFEDIGEYSYDTARAKIDEVIELIDISYYDTPTDRIEKTLEFIYQSIHYESEVNDIFLAPVETLGYKSGDCDDFSVLAAAILEDIGIDSAIGFFRNEENQYHAMVLVHLEELSGYYYWYFSDLTDKGLKEGRWMIIEPQLTIDYQNSDWIEQWNLLVAAPLD